MNAHDTPRAQYPTLLDGQLRLLARRWADMAALSEPGGDHDEATIDRIANDLVGVRLVIASVLLRSSPKEVSGAAREELELREREARELLRAVLAVLSRRRAAGSAP